MEPKRHTHTPTHTYSHRHPHSTLVVANNTQTLKHPHTHTTKLTNYKKQEEKQSGERESQGKRVVCRKESQGGWGKGGVAGACSGVERKLRNILKRDNALKIANRLRKPICGRCCTVSTFGFSFSPSKMCRRVGTRDEGERERGK